ncbi:MAG: polysaccharide biosynthesis/export family protein [Paludibacteraceae bacterium]|nr:polysaccharide biosynthesis/export family protein [Paludibacteraceae bacterium]MBO7337109.1 polysaccharide biosynthesis/export family protein [Paludibacteraceae bacterium]MBP5136677.1 polysaccharide biosynthesis/export family protein [Paludibacteraceae bacterium]
MAKALHPQTYILIALIVIMNSCVTSRKTNYLQNPKLGVKTYEQLDSTLLKQEYRLQVGDQVYINITSTNEEAVKLFTTGNANMMGNAENVNEMYSYTIYADSCIDFPFVGSIKIAGMTTREAKLMMTEKMQEYLTDCDVDLRLTNSYFTFIGQAGTGKYPIARERLTIYQALAISGDLKPFSDRKKVRIIRKNNDKTEVKTFDLRSKDIINSEFYYIRPNDIIYVPSFNGQFFGIASFSNLLSTITSTLSFGVLIYSLSTKKW